MIAARLQYLRGFLAALVLVATTPVAHADRAAEEAQLAFDDGPAPLDEVEARALALATTSRAWRNGGTLSIVTEKGQMLQFEDRDGCADGGGEDDCRHFHLVAHLPSRHLFLIAESFYEAGVYLLIDDRTGRQTLIPQAERPRFGPDEERFVVVDNDPHFNEGPVVQVWRRVDDTAMLEWHRIFTVRSLQSDERAPDWIDFVAWDESGIDLELGAYQRLAELEQRWPARLHREADGWHFKMDAPSQP